MPAFIDLDIDTAEIDRFIARFPVTGPQVVERELRSGMNEALGYVVAQVVDFTPHNTGILRDSIYDEPLGVRAGIGGIDVEGVVSSSDYEPKVMAVEFGRDPGKMPPVEAIALWVKQRQIVVKAQRVAGKKRKKATLEKLILRAAWGIAKHIAAVGTVGAFMFQEAAKASGDTVNKIFDEAVGRIVSGWAKEG